MKEKNIPLMDCPKDYILGDASGKLLNEYAHFPCKILCGVYAFVARGWAKVTVDITLMEAQTYNFIYLKPGTFIRVHEVSQDALVYYVVFSQKYIEKNRFINNFSLNAVPYFSPIIPLNEEHGAIITRMMELTIDAMNCTPSMLNSGNMAYALSVLQFSFYDHFRTHSTSLSAPQKRKQQIYNEYCQLVLNHYQKWHLVSQYAKHMSISLAHLCSTIKQVSGHTANDIIVDAILTDAKSQLKITNQQIKTIALSLGFPSQTIFTRFFKKNAGISAKEYRDS